MAMSTSINSFAGLPDVSKDKAFVRRLEGPHMGKCVELIPVDCLPAWVSVPNATVVTYGEASNVGQSVLTLKMPEKPVELVVDWNKVPKNLLPKRIANQVENAVVVHPKVPQDSSMEARVAQAANVATEGVTIQQYNPTTKGIFGKKIYCSHWIRLGECDFMQQGCMYKHVMPDIEMMEALGYSNYPRWFRERGTTFQLENSVDLDKTWLNNSAAKEVKAIQAAIKEVPSGPRNGRPNRRPNRRQNAANAPKRAGPIRNALPAKNSAGPKNAVVPKVAALPKIAAQNNGPAKQQAHNKAPAANKPAVPVNSGFPNNNGVRKNARRGNQYSQRQAAIRRNRNRHNGNIALRAVIKEPAFVTKHSTRPFGILSSKYLKVGPGIDYTEREKAIKQAGDYIDQKLLFPHFIKYLNNQNDPETSRTVILRAEAKYYGWDLGSSPQRMMDVWKAFLARCRKEVIPVELSFQKTEQERMALQTEHWEIEAYISKTAPLLKSTHPVEAAEEQTIVPDSSGSSRRNSDVTVIAGENSASASDTEMANSDQDYLIALGELPDKSFNTYGPVSPSRSILDAPDSPSVYDCFPETAESAAGEEAGAEAEADAMQDLQTTAAADNHDPAAGAVTGESPDANESAASANGALDAAVVPEQMTVCKSISDAIDEIIASPRVGDYSAVEEYLEDGFFDSAQVVEGGEVLEY